MITVNLFDDTFRQDLCSVAGKKPRAVRYVRDRMTWDGVTLFVDGYVRNGVASQVQSRYKIGWLHEPRCLHPENYEAEPVGDFDQILTYSAPLLDRPGYRFAPYGGVWLPRSEWGLRPKTKLVSLLVGDKTATAGHRMRRAVADALEPMGMVDFYGSRGTPTTYGWQTKRQVLAGYAFSIIVEACREDNLFTEILLDALAVGTVPIFWGAPNIGEFFDARGILSFETVEEAVALVRSLDMRQSQAMQPYRAANLQAISEYEVTEDWLYRHVLRRFA